jgi:hypothetical protein
MIAVVVIVDDVEEGKGLQVVERKREEKRRQHNVNGQNYEQILRRFGVALPSSPR